MRHFIYILTSALLLAAAVSCNEQEIATPSTGPGSGNGNGDGSSGVPEGWFVATFTAADTRAPINGTDTRVQHLRYIVFDADDRSFVKERLITIDAGGQQWPLGSGVIRDTLPVGSYKAVFLANIDPIIFDHDEEFEVLTGYQDGYSSARIHMPPIEFVSNTHYYMASAEFSDTAPSSGIMLQRIIGRMDIYRTALDIDDALDALVKNIIDSVIGGDLLTNTVKGLLMGPLEDALGPVAYLTGALDAVLNELTDILLKPILEAVYAILLDQLIEDVGDLLVANSESGAGLTEILTPILNPWSEVGITNAVVTIKDFPRSIDLDRNVTDVFEDTDPSDDVDGRQFVFSMGTGSIFHQKTLAVVGFDPYGLYDVQAVNILRDGLVGGLVVDGVAEGLLGNVLIDIGDPLSTAANAGDFEHDINEWLGAKYAILDLGLKNYEAAPGDDPYTTINIKLGDVLDLDSLLGSMQGSDSVVGALISAILKVPVLGDRILATLLDTLLDISLPIPIYLPLIGVDNLSISGSWTVVDQSEVQQ